MNSIFSPLFSQKVHCYITYVHLPLNLAVSFASRNLASQKWLNLVGYNLSIISLQSYTSRLKFGFSLLPPFQCALSVICCMLFLGTFLVQSTPASKNTCRNVTIKICLQSVDNSFRSLCQSRERNEKRAKFLKVLHISSENFMTNPVL